MRREPWYRLLLWYLRQYRLAAFCFLLFCGVFAMVFSLYELQVQAVGYAAALCAFLAACILAGHFIVCLRRHRSYEGVLRALRALPEEMPKPASLPERDLQEIAAGLRGLLREAQTQRQRERTESLDYYTTWAHQIKTPVAAMRMMLESEDTEENRALLAELFRIEQYVEMVLSYQRLGNGSSDYVFREYDLDGILRQAVHKYAQQFVRRRIRLAYEPVSCRVLTDEKWLLFLVEQLLSNSVKYTPAGGTVRISLSGKILCIADTGIGIAAEDLPRIFEKGFTGYNGRAEKKSTGLGLYLCKTVAARLSHRIWAESEPGKGTRVYLDLRTDPLAVE